MGKTKSFERRNKGVLGEYQFTERRRPFSFGAVFGHRQMIKEDTKDFSFATWPLQIWIEGQSTSIGVAVQSIN